ncbi:hypothetical protein ABPG75_012377 [Micractinium tetrahymenae]
MLCDVCAGFAQRTEERHRPSSLARTPWSSLAGPLWHPGLPWTVLKPSLHSSAAWQLVKVAVAAPSDTCTRCCRLPMMADLPPGPPPSPGGEGGRRGRPSLLDMPPEVLQLIMQLVLQSEGDEPFPLPDGEAWAGGVVARRLPPHILPESLLACKALCQAALASPPTYVRVQLHPGASAAQMEQQFAACADSVRMLELAGHLPAGCGAGRCL